MPRYGKYRNNSYVRDIILRLEESKEERHERGRSMVDSVSPVVGYHDTAYPKWGVVSSSGSGTYEVKRNDHEHVCMSEKWCDMKCEHCDACRNSYKCECPDYMDNENLCKHIHAVCIYLNKLDRRPDTLLNMLRQGNPSASDSSSSDGDTDTRGAVASGSTREPSSYLINRIIAEAEEVTRKLPTKIAQLPEEDMRFARVLLRQLRHIVRDRDTSA